MDQCMLVIASGSHKPAVTSYFQRRLSGLDYSVDVGSESQGILLIEPSQVDLELEASHLKLQKPLKRDASKLEEFDVELRDAYEGVDGQDFFLPFEKAYMTSTLLNALKVDEDFMSIARQYGWRGASDPRLHEGSSLITACKRLGFVEYMTPVHRRSILTELWKKSLRSFLAPAHDFRNYFGEGVAYYWAWMNFYTLCLVVPAIVGLAMYSLNKIEGYTVDDSPYVPFFSVFMVFWSAGFLKFWRRKSVTWAFKWDTLDEQKKDTVRPGFTGKLMESPITGEPELTYPWGYRFLKYIVSAAVTGAILLVAFCLMILSLNLQGYVHNSNSWLYAPALSNFSEPGAIFDPECGNWPICMLPVLIHVIVIQILNRIYRHVAEMLTDWENHRTKQDHENSLILKRFFFEAFDSYIALFYLAFYEMDMLKVRRELVSLYTVDCVRRLATECLLPVIIQLLQGGEVRKELKRMKSSIGEKPSALHAVEDSRKDQYEEFDDYLEMVIEFGYVTMFASAFPLAASIQVLYNLVEMKSDCFKMCYVCQRPPVARENGIGSWGNVLHAQAVLSVLTNVVLFAFTSDQILHWFPFLFSYGDFDDNGDVDKVVLEGKGQFVVLIMFALEHILGLGMFLIFSCISDIPEHVHTGLKKREYERQKELIKMKKTMRLEIKGSKELTPRKQKRDE